MDKAGRSSVFGESLSAPCHVESATGPRSTPLVQSASPYVHGLLLTALMSAMGTASAQTPLPDVMVQTAAELPSDLPKPYPGGQLASGAHLGVMGKTSVMNAPFNITSFTSKTIEDQQARSISSVISQNDPSVRQEYGDGTTIDALIIRGFPVSNDEIQLNGLPGILAPFRISPEFVERAEVLKGPSAFLNGVSPSGAVGGNINLISKRATDEPITRLSTAYASSSVLAINADIARRFGKDHAFGIRVNAGARQGDTARDYLGGQTRNVSVGLDFQSSRLRASVDLIHQKQTMQGAQGSVNLSAFGGPAPAAPDGSLNYAQPWNRQHSDDSTLMAQVEYDLSDRLTLFGALGHGRDDSTARISTPPYVLPSGDFYFSSMPVTWRQRSTAGNVGVKGQFETGPVRHDWSIRAETFRRNANLRYYFAELGAGTGISNIYHPPALPAPPPGDPSSPPLIWDVHTSLPSVVLSDTLTFADGAAGLTLGVRRQTLKLDSQTGDVYRGFVGVRYDQTVTSPMIALRVNPVKNVTLYANHTQGLAMGDSAPLGTTNAGEAFSPYKTKQVEVGVKVDWGRIFSSVSVFQISKPYASIDPNSNTFGVTGKQRHRGLEFNVYGEVARGVRLLGGATFLDAQVNDSAYPMFQDTRPVGVARQQLTVAGEWDVSAVPGLTLLSRAVQSGSVYADTANLTKVPGWTTVDLGVRYATRAWDKPVTFRATVENAFNKRYWKQGAYAATLGMPRTLVVSSTVAF